MRNRRHKAGRWSGGHCKRPGALKQTEERLPQFRRAAARGAGPGHDDVVARRQIGTVMAETVAHDALDAVASDGVWIDLAGDRQTQSRGLFTALPMHSQHGQRHAPAVLEDSVEVGTRTHPRGARETARRHEIGAGGGQSAALAGGRDRTYRNGT